MLKRRVKGADAEKEEKKCLRWKGGGSESADAEGGEEIGCFCRESGREGVLKLRR